jgi:hypothetical protein
MRKPLFAMVLGGVLGAFDGLSAMLSAPETRPAIVGIVIGSTVKGLIVGALIGFFANRVRSVGWTVVFGVAVGALFAYFVAAMQGKYYAEIITPGALVGLIVGFAAQNIAPQPSL